MKAHLIFNPTAGQVEVRQDLDRVMDCLQEQGWIIHWRETRGPGDALTYAREAAASGCDLAIAAGGDGTVGQVAGGLVGTDTALGVLPIGTSNVWAKEVGLPVGPYLVPPQLQASLGVGTQKLMQSATVLAEGRRVAVDVGKINNHYFLMWAGVGLDARVAEEVEHHPEVKRHLGRLAFIVAILYISRDYRGVRARIRVDGRWTTRRIILAVASNIQLYGGVVRISPLARLDDGMLDLCIFQGRGALSSLGHLLAVLVGRHLESPEVDSEEARRIEIHPSVPLPVHADGDFIGYTPATIEVLPRALQVVVPQEMPARLLRSADGSPETRPWNILDWLSDFVPYDPKTRWKDR